MQSVSNGANAEAGGGGNGTSDAGKRPKKGILKTSSSFDRTGASCRKSAKFDELNVLQTFHPADKDYGHMKIGEPKTPYSLAEPDSQRDQLDAELLAEKLRIAANTQTPSFDEEEDSDEELEETPEEKARRIEFERRRKAHYNEAEAFKLARKLIEKELARYGNDDDGDEANQASNSEKSTTQATNSTAESNAQTQEQNSQISPNIRQMDVDLPVGHSCHGREKI